MIVECKLTYEESKEIGSLTVQTNKLSNQDLIRALSTKEEITFGYPDSDFDIGAWEELKDDLEDGAKIRTTIKLKKEVDIFVNV